jgi:gluconokinase
VTCSALRRAYRDVLRAGHPSVWFVHVDVPEPVLRDRLLHRRGHYMPASLLSSQLATLEPLQPDEPGTVVSGEGSAEATSDLVLAALHRHQDPPT